MPDTPISPLILPKPTPNLNLSDVVNPPKVPVGDTQGNSVVADFIRDTQNRALTALMTAPIMTPYKIARRFDDPLWGFDPSRPDQEDLYAKNQGIASSLASGLGRFVTTTLTKTGSGIGFIFGSLGNTLDTDATSSFNNWVSSTADNSFSAFFNRLEQDIKEDWLPIYQEASDRNKGFWARAATDLNFWTEDFVDGAAFMASTLVPGMALSKLGTGSKLVRALSRLTGETGIVGEEASILKAAIESGTNISKYSKVDLLPKVSKWISNAKLARNTDVGITSILSTASEAMFEANETKHQVIENLRGKVNPETGLDYTEDEIKQKSALAARDTYLGNLATLALSNVWEANLLFKRLPSTSSVGGAAEVTMGEGLLSQAAFNKPNYFKEFLKNAGKGIGVEGFWEENMQLAISRFNQSKVDPSNNETRKFSNSVLDNYINQTVGALSGKDKEAALSIGLGGILGGIIGGVMSTKEDRRKDKELEGKVIQYNNIAATFKNLELHEKEEVEVTSPDGTKTKVKVTKLDANGNPIINKAAINTLVTGHIERARLMDMIDKAEKSGNQSMYEMLRNEAISQLALAHFQMGKADALYEKLNNVQNLKPEDISLLGFDSSSREKGLVELPKIVAKVRQLEELYNDVQENIVPTKDEDFDEKRRQKLFELGSRQLFLREELNRAEVRALQYETTNPTIDELNKLVAAENAAMLRRRGLELLVEEELQQDQTSDELIKESEDLLNETKEAKEKFIEENKEEIDQFNKDEEGFYTDPTDFSTNIVRQKRKMEELEKAAAIRLSLVETVNRFNKIADPKKGASYFKNFTEPKDYAEEYSKLDQFESMSSFEEDKADLNDRLRVISENKRYDELTSAIPQLLDEVLPLSERIKILEKSRSPLAKELLSAYKKEIDEFKQRMGEALEVYLRTKTEQEELEANKELKDKLNKEQSDLDKEGSEDGPTNNDVSEAEFYSGGFKKHINWLFKSTQALDEWGNKAPAHGIRQNKFLFRIKRGIINTKGRNIESLLVTANNEKSIGLEGFIAHHLKDSSVEIDVKDYKVSPYITIYVETDSKGRSYFLNEKGERISKVGGKQKVDFDQLVYGVLPTNELTWSSKYGNEPRYQYADRKGKILVKKEEAEEYARKWDISRKRILELTTAPLYKFGISNGIVEVEYLIEKLEEKARVKRKSSVVGTVVNEEDLQDPLIIIPTTDTLTINDITYSVPNGRPFIVTPDSTSFYYLNNQKLSPDKADTIFELLKKLSEQGTLSGPIATYLRSIIYFGSPKEGITPSKSQIWVHDGKINIGGRDFFFSPLNLEANKELITSIITNNIYHNIQNSALKDDNFNTPYDEVIGINEDGSLKIIRWKNYQYYLLSDKYVLDEADQNDLNGKERGTPPLTVGLRPLKDQDDVNLHSIYSILEPRFETDYITEEEQRKPVTKKIEGEKKEEGQKSIDPVETGFIAQGFTINKIDLQEFNITYYEKDGQVVVKEDDNYNQLFDKYLKSESFKKNVFAILPEDIKNELKDDIDSLISEYAKGAIVRRILDSRNNPIKEEQPAPQPEEKVIPPTTSEETEKSAEDILKEKRKNRRNRPNSNYSRVVGSLIAREKENWRDVKVWLNRNFPNVPLYIVQNLIETTDGGFAWGEMTNAGITVYEAAEAGTTYHEAFEALWNKLLTRSQRQGLLNEFRTREGSYFDAVQQKVISYKDATDFEAKERMADEFKEFKLTGKKPIKVQKTGNIIVRFFEDLLNFLNSIIFSSPKSIEDLFKKMDSGFYKRRDFLQRNMAFQSPAYSRIPGLNTATQRDLIEGITLRLVQDMYAHNRSVVEFDESEISVAQHYENVFNLLKEEFEEFKQDDYEDAVDAVNSDSSISDKQKEKILERLKEIREEELKIWGVVQTNWKKVTELNNQYLLLYNIGVREIKEPDENEKTEEQHENKNQVEYANEHFVHDGKKNAPASIKLLIATLSESLFDEDGKLTEVYSPLNLPKKVDYIKTFNQLAQSLKDVNTLEEKRAKLQELAKQNPNLQRLYNRLFKAKPTLDDYKLMIKWFNVFSTQRPEPLIMYVSEEGVVNFGSANLQDEITVTVKQWIDELKVKATTNPDGPVKILGNTDTYYFDVDVLKDVEIKTIRDKIKFLDLFGIKFKEKDYYQFTEQEKKVFNDSISSIKTTLSKNTGILLANNSKSLTIDGSLRNIAGLQVALNYQNFDSTYFNIDGEKVQVNTQTNFISSTINDLNNAESLQDLYGRLPYLKGDNLSNNSVWLQKFFKTDGTRDNKFRLKLKYIQGIIDLSKDDTNTNIERLSYPTRVLQEFNLNLLGNYQVLVPADSKTEWVIDSGLTFKFDEFNSNIVWEKIYNTFWNYYQVEVSEGKLGLTLDIVGDENLSLDKETFSAKVKDFIKERSKETKDFFFEYGIFLQDDKNIIVNKVVNDFMINNFGSNTITEEQLDQMVDFRTVNYIVNNYEMMKLFFGDINEYKDPLKRFKSFLSPRETSIHSTPIIDRTFNKEYNQVEGIKLNAKVPGNTLYSDAMNTIVLEDIESISPLYEKLQQLSLSPEEKKSFKKYLKNNEADGQSYATLPQYRQIMQKSGRWSNNHEKLYQHLMAKDRLNMEKDGLFNYEEAGVPTLRSIDIKLLLDKPVFKEDVFFPVLKPIGSGRFTDSYPFLDKTSLAPLTYSLVRGTSMATVYKKAMDQQIGYLIYESGRKVGTKLKNKLYNKDGTVNSSPFKKIQKVPFKYYGIQVETLGKKDRQVRGTQLTKLAVVNFFNNGVPIDVNLSYSEWIKLSREERENQSEVYRLVSTNFQLLNKMTQEGYYRLLDKFDIEDTGTSFIIRDHKKVQKLLQNELFRREVEDNIKDAITVNPETGQFDIPFEAIPKYRQIQSILFSYVDKLIVKPKLNGGPKVQVSGALFEGNRIVNEKGKLVSSGLKFYDPVIENGNVVSVARMEIYLPNWFRKNLSGTKYERMSDSQLIKELNNSDILNGIGFRIPTQEMNSIESFTIKGFLPEEFGDTVVVPAEITTKAGSDFDVDKLNTYLKNIFVDEKGNISEVPYFNSLEEAREYVEKLTIIGLLDLSTVKSGPTLDELKDGELKDDNEDANIAERFYIQGLENAYFKSLDKLILHPLNFKRLISPNSSDKMISLRDNLFNSLGDKEVGSLQPSILNPMYMSKRRHAFIAGKGGVGIAAIAQTANALSQLGSVLIDFGKLTLLSEEKRHFLDPYNKGFVEIRLPHNQINLSRTNGTRADFVTFSSRTTQENTLISDSISQYINGFVDVGKDTFIIDIGATTSTAGTFLIMERMGIPSEIVVMFMNQPIIREYLKLLSKNDTTWLLNYSPFSTNKYGDYVNAMFTKFASPEKFEGTEFNYKNFKTNIETYYKEGKELTGDQKAEQRQILVEFLKYSQLANQMREYIQGSNYDTANINNSLILHKKSYQESVARTETIFSSVDNYMNKSHIAQIRDKVMLSHKALADTLFKVEKEEIFSVLASNIFDVFLNRKMSEDKYLKAANNVILEYFTFTLFNNNPKFREINKLMIDKETSVASQLLSLPKKGDLENNAVLQALKVREDRGKVSGIKNVSLSTKAEGIFKSNLYTEALRELRDNVHTQGLYNDLIILAFLQSGLTNSPISFTNLIPNEDFVKIMLPIVPNLDNVNNVTNFVNSGSFFRNNWHNNNVVPVEKDKGVFRTYDDVVVHKSFDITDGELPSWYQKELYRQGITQFLPMLKVWEGKNSSKSPYVKVRSVAINPETGEKYTKGEIREMRKKGDSSWLITTLFRRVESRGGVPLKINYHNRESKWVAYVPVNAWGDGFRLQEHYTDGRMSQVENNTLKVAKEADIYAIYDAYHNMSPAITAPVISTGKDEENNLYGPDGLPKLNDENQNSCK